MSGVERESALGVVGMALGALVLVACIGTLMMLGKPDATLDASEVLRQRFGAVGEWPYGMEVVGAQKDLHGREVVRIESPRAVLFDASEGPDAVVSLEGESLEAVVPGARIEWERLPAVEGAHPVRAALVWYPRKDAEKVLREQFTALRFESGRGGGMGGGGGGHGGGMGKPGDPPKAPDPKLQDGGTITWAGYAAPYVRLREFELSKDGRGVLYETVRVNLTLGEYCCVLFLKWGPGEVGSREKTKAVLDALTPRESAGA